MARTALYRHFDADGLLLYVGISDALSARDRQHAAASSWHDQVRRTQTEWLDTREHALALEAVAIAFECPVYNLKRSNPETYRTVRGSKKAPSGVGPHNLKGFLDHSKMTQVGLADRVGVSQSALSKLCSGKTQPSLETAVALARETGGAVSVTDWQCFAPLAPASTSPADYRFCPDHVAEGGA